MTEERDVLNKLRKILSVSKSVELGRMRRALELDQATFDKKIFDWAAEFGFEIDREYVNVGSGDINQFIDHLEGQFAQWEMQAEGGFGKIDTAVSQTSKPKNMEGKNRNAIERSGMKPKKTRKLMDFRGVQIPSSEVEVLRALENQTDKKFSEIDEINWFTEMGFTVKKNRVTGIGLYECGISTLPEPIGSLKSLEKIDLSVNSITTLPVSIGNLKSLKKLSLWRNKITNLPEPIGSLKSLEYLNLGSNFITILPESIGQLPSLKELDLFGNPLDKKLFGSTKTEEILKKLKRNGVNVVM